MSGWLSLYRGTMGWDITYHDRAAFLLLLAWLVIWENKAERKGIISWNVTWLTLEMRSSLLPLGWKNPETLIRRENDIKTMMTLALQEGTKFGVSICPFRMMV